jgi:hypothetical protein
MYTVQSDFFYKKFGIQLKYGPSELIPISMKNN